MFKIVADQASNNKKAFRDEVQCDFSAEIVKTTNTFLHEQRKTFLDEKQERLRKELETEIEELNSIESIKAVSTPSNSKKRKREDVLNDVDSDINDSLLEEFLYDDDVSI